MNNTRQSVACQPLARSFVAKSSLIESVDSQIASDRYLDLGICLAVWRTVRIRALKLHGADESSSRASIDARPTPRPSRELMRHWPVPAAQAPQRVYDLFVNQQRLALAGKHSIILPQLRCPQTCLNLLCSSSTCRSISRAWQVD